MANERASDVWSPVLVIVTLALLIPGYLDFVVKFALSRDLKELIHLMALDTTLIIMVFVSEYIALLSKSKKDDRYIWRISEVTSYVVISLTIVLVLSWTSFFYFNPLRSCSKCTTVIRVMTRLIMSHG